MSTMPDTGKNTYWQGTLLGVCVGVGLWYLTLQLLIYVRG